MRILSLLVGLCLVGFTIQSSLGADDSRNRDAGEENPPADVQQLEVELFPAILSRQLDVGVVAHNYWLVSMQVRNRTPFVLKVKLPKTFGVVPVERWQAMRQMVAAGRSLESFNSGHGYDSGGSQGLGGSLAGPWNPPSLNESDPNNRRGDGALVNKDKEQGDSGKPVAKTDNRGKKGNNQAGGGQDPNEEPAKAGPGQPAQKYWTIVPRGVFRVQVPTFCLEFGKPDPNRGIAYTICPLEYVNRKPVVNELIDRFGQGGWDQRVAQLAAWHVANGTPWQVMAKIKFPRTPGRSRTVTPIELLGAQKLVQTLSSLGRPSLGNY